MLPYLVKIETDKNTKLVINDIIKNLKLNNFKPRYDFHVTLIFADTYKAEPKLNKNVSISVKPVKVDLFGKALVLTVDDKENLLRNRHYQLKSEMTATTQHNDYTPHLTIGYAQQDFILTEDLKTKILSAFNNMDFVLDEERGKVFVPVKK